MNEIEQLMPELSITIYTTPDCSKCRMLKSILDEKNIVYVEENAIEKIDDIKDSGLASAPIIVVVKGGDKQYLDMDGFYQWLKDEGLL